MIDGNDDGDDDNDDTDADDEVLQRRNSIPICKYSIYSILSHNVLRVTSPRRRRAFAGVFDLNTSRGICI